MQMNDQLLSLVSRPPTFLYILLLIADLPVLAYFCHLFIFFSVFIIHCKTLTKIDFFEV